MARLARPLPRIVFHRDGEVSVGGVRVGLVSGEAHRWTFRANGHGGDRDPEGPFRNRTPIKKRAREIFQVMEEQRIAAFADGR